MILQAFRWSNKPVLRFMFGALVATGSAIAATPAVSRDHERPDRVQACPARLLGQPLRNGQVLDGPPRDIAILRGDDLPAPGNDIRVIWNVQYIYRRGSLISLECEYSKVGKAYLAVTTPVKACRFSQHREIVRLSCR